MKIWVGAHFWNGGFTIDNWMFASLSMKNVFWSFESLPIRYCKMAATVEPWFLHLLLTNSYLSKITNKKLVWIFVMLYYLLKVRFSEQILLNYSSQCIFWGITVLKERGPLGVKIIWTEQIFTGRLRLIWQWVNSSARFMICKCPSNDWLLKSIIF